MDYCMRQGGAMMDAALMRMLLDCSDMCGTCADMIMRDSGSMKDICRMCADMCTRCADMCAKMPDDQQMAACAEACRRAAAACRTLAAAK
ncbi:four-helix bundle copper-binding protein [Parafrankia discariae]|uniref:four-helix bundle copper-binding protein n=1 Tax=Parafrankia TaxID=2994362 RepID=UPI001E2ECE32|nr:four-helix bundle copper-binding protein [Parafrankia discariae]